MKRYQDLSLGITNCHCSNFYTSKSLKTLVSQYNCCNPATFSVLCYYQSSQSTDMKQNFTSS